jgi:hypothetical protein
MTYDNLEDFKSYIIKYTDLDEKHLSHENWNAMFLIYKEDCKEHQSNIKQLTSNEHLQKLIKKYIPEHVFTHVKKSRPYKNVYTTEYQGVTYGITITGNISIENDPEGELEKRIMHSANHFKLIKERHHNIIKKAFDYCASLNVGDIWCMIGGGCQLQIFFGNHKSTLAIIYLSLDDEKFKKKKNYTIIPQSNENDLLFKNISTIDGIKLQTCKSLYG